MIVHVLNRGNARDQISDQDADYAAIEKMMTHNIVLTPFSTCVTTLREIAIQVLKGNLRTCRRYAQELLVDKNILSSQLEILMDELKMSETDKRLFWRNAESEL